MEDIMKKTIPFNLFNEEQTIYFDIPRLEELELKLGDSILNVVRNGNAGIRFCIAGLKVGLKHHIKPEIIIEKVEQYFDNGGNLDELSIPIIRAVLASGIFGKPETKESERKNVVKAEEIQ
jgi:hypothetical protein